MKKNFKLLICIGGGIVLATIVVLGIIILTQKDAKIKDRIGYTVECQTKDDDDKSMNVWFKDYMKQFEQKRLEKDLIVKDYVVTSTKLLGDNIIKIDFTIKSHQYNQKLEKVLDGVYDSKEYLIKCRWILKYEVNNEKDKIYYKVIDVYDPNKKYENNEFKVDELKKEEKKEKQKEEYKEKYKTSDELSRQAYNKEFMLQEKSPKIDATNTYRIYNDVCSTSYDKGIKWTDVPVPLEELCRVMDGNSYFNKLQDGSYIISPEKTILAFGGTTNTALSIVKSVDQGGTWKKVVVDNEHKIIYSGRLKYISFVSDRIGYIVVTTERAMSAEAKAIFKTTDGGDSWTEIKSVTNINIHKLYKATFLTENLGFMSMVCSEKPELFRTEDGGKTWNVIDIDMTDSYKQPEIPYIENGRICLMINEGVEEVNNKKALYISDDDGNSFKFEKEFEN